MYHNIKKGHNNKTFYLDGLYYHKGDWIIDYSNLEAATHIHGINWEKVTFGIKNKYNHSIHIVDNRPLEKWRYDDTKTFDDSKDFIKRVGSFLGY